MNIYSDKYGNEHDLALSENGICWLYPMKRGMKLKAAGKPERDDALPVPIPAALLSAHFTKVPDGQDEYSRKFLAPKQEDRAEFSVPPKIKNKKK